MIWSRWSGAGNSFFIADQWNQKWDLSREQRPEYVKKICQAFPDAVTDGLLFLEKHPSYDFAWDFYNSDGSRAEMCGNAARCVGTYFHEKIYKQKSIRFLTAAGEVEANLIDSDRVRVKMPELPQSTAVVEGTFHINTGVPHFVVAGEPDLRVVTKLRPAPPPFGSNVTFVTKVSENGCVAVAFERGVEGYTAACGTGAVAAGVYLAQKFGNRKFEIQMPGGRLIVENAVLGQRPFLEGEAKKNYEFEYLDSKGDCL